MPLHQGNGLNTFLNNLLKTTNPKCERENSMLDSPFIADLKVPKGIAQLKNKKATGNDSVSNEMINTGSPTILPFLVTLFFNTILETKSYPEDWSCRISDP